MNRHVELIAFVLDQAATAPAKKRARLYRAVADICGHSEESDSLNQMADAIDRAEELCREFMFKFNQKNKAE